MIGEELWIEKLYIGYISAPEEDHNFLLYGALRSTEQVRASMGQHGHLPGSIPKNEINLARSSGIIRTSIV